MGCLIPKISMKNQPGSTHESSLLLTLEEISRLVSHSHDPHETLENIVHLIQGRFHTDVCSVYLLESDRGELVLGATVGLKPESVGRVRMRLEEGLTGLVAEQMAPVTVSDAFQHPRFKYFPEAGEDPYHSFLGVPLVECGALQGVLVVQTVDKRDFSPNEIRMLVTVGSQLASMVSGARLLEKIVAAAHQDTQREASGKKKNPATLQGTPLSPGVGWGPAYLVNGFDEWLPTGESRSEDCALETRRLNQAMDSARLEITHLSQRISTLVGEDHGGILQAQLMIMQDRTIEQDLTECLQGGCTAEAALRETLNKYVAAFQKLTTPFFQERVFDIKDVFRRIFWHLRPQAKNPETEAGRVVLVAHEASVTDLFSMDLDRLAAVVVEHGGPQSHAAILARSLGVPMVGMIPDFAVLSETGKTLLVDGNSGVIYPDPPHQLVVSYSPSPQSHADLAPEPSREEALDPDLPVVEANINLLYEVRQAVGEGACAVGLYRTEFLFLARRTLPTEEEQVEIYSKLLEKLGGRPASIRTFDMRPDKLAHHPHWTLSAQAFDWRLVLESQPMRKLFRDQIRAILRAATLGPARILVPMVLRTELLDFVLATVDQAKKELRSEGLDFGEQVPLGITIEGAAAAPLVELWSDQVDFFALGTNDLAASALGLDRNDPVGAQPNDAFHPGMLRLMDDVIRAAHEAGKPVTVCGEIAGDPHGVLAMAALQVDSISVAVHQIAVVRRSLAKHSSEELTRVASQFLHLRTGDQVRDFLGQFRTLSNNSAALTTRQGSIPDAASLA
jgi:phosphotransferase system, enzyme I, PtsP